MQGIFIDYRRPKSKKEIREIAAVSPERISIEATSAFGNEFEGNLTSAPDSTITFVGPDPYTKRNFYGQIIIDNGKVTVK